MASQLKVGAAGPEASSEGCAGRLETSAGCKNWTARPRHRGNWPLELGEAMGVLLVDGLYGHREVLRFPKDRIECEGDLWLWE